MRKGSLLILVMAGLLVWGAGSASAFLMDFDSLPVGNIDGVNLGGVTITSPDGSASVVLGDQVGIWGWTSYANTVSNNGFLTTNPLTFTFDVPRGFVQFTGGDAGGDTDRFTVQTFDFNGNPLSFFDTGVFGGNPADPLNFMVDAYTVTFDNALNGTGFIKTMVVTEISGNSGILIDDLNFCQPIPIPGAVWLLGSGLLGLVGWRRSRKS